MDDNAGKEAGSAYESGAVGKLTKEMVEKRRFERLRAALQIKYRVMGPEDVAALTPADYVAPGAFKANTVEMSDFKKLTNEEVMVSENISLHGVRISVAHPMAEGTRLWLQVSLPGAPIPLHAIGEVRWCHSSGTQWNAGLKFVGISRADLGRVDGFLTRQQRNQENAQEGQTPQEIAEKRSFNRLQASLDIKYRLVGAEEEAALKQNDYVAPGAFKAHTTEVQDFNTLANGEVVVSEDISLGGLKISVSNPMTEGMKLLLQVTIPGVPIPVNAIGEVRWCRAVGDLWNAGLMFSGLNKSDLDRVDRFLLLQKRAQMAKRE
jgi:DNA-nicking Smr family endonuclease